MAAFYLDASAIAKLYLPGELGVDFVIQLLELRSPEDRVFTSGLSIVEVKAAISRRIESPTDRAELLAMYDDDAHEMFKLLPVSDDIIIRAGAVTEDYRLRAGDAIHLATALSVAAATTQQVSRSLVTLNFWRRLKQQASVRLTHRRTMP